MARPRNSLPKYCVSKDGRAFTTVSGKFHSFGKDGPEARKRYAALLVELDSRTDEAPKADRPAPLSCNELALAFINFAQQEYVDRETGKPSAEVKCYQSAIKQMRMLFGETAAAEFGPNKLRIVRDQFVAKGWSRGFINKSVIRLRHVWRWGVSHEMVPEGCLERLKSLEPLKAGKSTARETTSREAVPAADINAAKARMTQKSQDLIDLLLLTGARTSEILSLTTAMLHGCQTIDGTWIVPLKHHKNAHRGHQRRLYFNAAAQAILLRYLKLKDPGARLFPIKQESFSKCVKQA